VDTGTWSVVDRSAFESFSVVLLLVPELRRWTGIQKQALIEIICAKGSGDESDYLRLSQRHHALREALLRLGSRNPAAESARS